MVGISANEKLPRELTEKAKIVLSDAAQQLANRLNDLAGDGIKSTGKIKPPRHELVHRVLKKLRIR